MIRYSIIDNLRGIAFILMVIQHIFYFKDVSNDYTTSYSSNIFVDYSGIIARTLFIFLAGLSLSLIDRSKVEKKIKRIGEIAIHALIISLVTYIYYPKYFVRFGILHFMALASLIVTLLLPILDSIKIRYKLLLLISLVFIKPPLINSFIDTITGAQIHNNMMDWFPLHPWIILFLFGFIIGEDKSSLEHLNNININSDLLRSIGQNTLNLYTIHVIILIVYYNSLKK
jgi:uncharacterized membrane protein